MEGLLQFFFFFGGGDCIYQDVGLSFNYTRLCVYR